MAAAVVEDLAAAASAVVAEGPALVPVQLQPHLKVPVEPLRPRAQLLARLPVPADPHPLREPAALLLALVPVLAELRVRARRLVKAAVSAEAPVELLSPLSRQSF